MQIKIAKLYFLKVWICLDNKHNTIIIRLNIGVHLLSKLNYNQSTFIYLEGKQL